MQVNIYEEYYNRVLDGLKSYKNFTENIYIEHLQRLQDEVEDEEFRKVFEEAIVSVDLYINDALKQLEQDLHKGKKVDDFKINTVYTFKDMEKEINGEV